MPLFSADTTILSKKNKFFFAHVNMKKCPHNRPKSQFLLLKNCSPRDLCMMTLVSCGIWNSYRNAVYAVEVECGNRKDRNEECNMYVKCKNPNYQNQHTQVSSNYMQKYSHLLYICCMSNHNTYIPMSFTSKALPATNQVWPWDTLGPGYHQP